MHRFIPLLLILLAPLGAHAQRADLRGYVMTAEGKPLPGANVLLEPVDGGKPAGQAADASGAFHFAELAPGSYLLRVRFVGYERWSTSVDLAAGEHRTVTVELEDAPLTSDEVLVTAMRVRPQIAPVTASTLTAAELARQPAMKDLPVQLASTPAITFSSQSGNGIGYTSLRMRGFGQRRLAVAVNGIPQNDPESFEVYWINFYGLQSVLRDVQVQRGAGAAFYGPAAIGGAINMIVRPYRTEPSLSVESGYGTYATRKLAVEANSGILGGRWILFGRLGWMASDGYRDGSWSEFIRYFAGATYRGDDHQLTLQAHGGVQQDGLAFSGIRKAANEDDVLRRANPGAATGDEERFDQPHVSLLHDWQIDDGIAVNQALFLIRGVGYFDFDGSFRSPEYLRLPVGTGGWSDAERSQPFFLLRPEDPLQFRAALDLWQVGWLPKLTLDHRWGSTRVGLEARLHRGQSWGRIQRAPSLPEALTGMEAPKSYRYHTEKLITSGFVSHRYRIAGWLELQGDLQATYRRYRVFDEAYFGHDLSIPFTFLNPRIGASFNPGQPWMGYVSFALAQREPRRAALYDATNAGAGAVPQFVREEDGTYDTDEAFVRPERLWDLEVGTRWQGERTEAAANLFWMRFEDEIVPSGGVDQYGVPRTGNADRTRHVGLELETSAEVLPGLTLDANATWSRNRFVRFTEYVAADSSASRDGNTIAGFPDLIVNAGLSYARGGGTLALRARHVGRQFVDNANRTGDGVVPAHTLVDLSLRYQPEGTLLSGLELALDVNNLLDERALLRGVSTFAGPRFFPAATRHLYVGLRYTIE